MKIFRFPTDDQMEQLRRIERELLLIDFAKVCVRDEFDFLVHQEIEWGGELGKFFAQKKEGYNRKLRGWIASERVKPKLVKLKDTNDALIRRTLKIPNDLKVDNLFEYAARANNIAETRDFDPDDVLLYEEMELQAFPLRALVAAWQQASFLGGALNRAMGSAVLDNEGPRVLEFFQKVKVLQDYRSQDEKDNPPDDDFHGDHPVLVKGKRPEWSISLGGGRRPVFG